MNINCRKCPKYEDGKCTNPDCLLYRHAQKAKAAPRSAGKTEEDNHASR